MLLAVLLVAASAPPAAATGTLNRPAPMLTASAAYVVDADTGEVLLEQAADERRPIASTTKIMTAVVVLDHVPPTQLDREFQIGTMRPRPGETLMGLRTGDRTTTRELLYGLMLSSGNDAAVALAQRVAGSEQRFVSLMNTTAGILGLRDTHFMNPHGLHDPDHYSTARDLARLAQHAMRYRGIAEIAGTQVYATADRPGTPSKTLVNLNVPLYYYPGVTGVKPGWTGRAGVCQVVTVTLDGRSIIAVLLNAGPAASDMKQLLDWVYGTRSFPAPPDHDRSTVRGSGADGQPWTYYAATRQRVRAGFLRFYESVGGPDVLGFPISEELREDGRTVQYFQRARLEWHPERARTPYEVQITLLGEQLAAARGLLPQPAVPPFASWAWHRYFPETEHSVHSAFLRFYDRAGGADVLGYPITQELSSDVDWPHAVQYFQRGRLQYHPDRAGTRQEVQASLLGEWAWHVRAATGTPGANATTSGVLGRTQPVPRPTATPRLPPWSEEQAAMNQPTPAAISGWVWGSDAAHARAWPQALLSYFQNLLRRGR